MIEKWWFLCLVMFGGFCAGISAGSNITTDKALINKCQETNGKYDFCQEIKQWGVK